MEIQPHMGTNGEFYWFFGIVEDRQGDPLQLGRVRVRVFGPSGASTAVATDSLPWASIMMPATSASHAGVGISPTGITKGAMVFGFFLDGPAAQQPVVIGTFAGIPKGVSDVSGLATGETIIEKGEEPFEPENPAAPEYPYNKVYTSESGHVIEIDDTSGSERIHVYHKTGTYFEIGPDGSSVLKSTKDNYHVVVQDNNAYIGGSLNVYVKEDASLHVAGNADIAIEGDAELKIGGDVKVTVEGDAEATVKGSTELTSNGVTITSDVSIKGDVDVKGTVTASEDVVGGGKSLKTHTHTGVHGTTSAPN